ncbi:MAG: hypothetical protein FWC07_12580, partial [Defluviitaleaceae bacterium]|nr:hypothetical protein [Defluviitaleaceae bacterium]
MKKYSLPILLALFFALAACGFLPEDPPAPFFPDIEFSLEAPDDLPDAPNPRLPEYTALSREDDGILRLPMRVPLTLNPLLNRDKTVARVLGLLFEPLAVLDAELRPVGHLAELEFSLDFSGVVATIHHEAIWSDGMPVSSDDLIFSVEALRHAPEDAIYRHVVENIASITRMDERTAKIAFHYATPAAGYALLFP